MSTIRTNTLLAADGSTTTEPSIPALDQRMAKAWVNFNGTGTVAIRDSYNVSSISDTAQGRFTINIETALASVDYLMSGSAGNFTGQTTVGRIVTRDGEWTTTACQIRINNDVGGAVDDAYNGIAIMGGQA